MPNIFQTVVAGIKPEHVSLFNLLFAMEISLKKGTVSIREKKLFMERFTRIKNFKNWRKSPNVMF